MSRFLCECFFGDTSMLAGMALDCHIPAPGITAGGPKSCASLVIVNPALPRITVNRKFTTI